MNDASRTFRSTQTSWSFWVQLAMNKGKGRCIKHWGVVPSWAPGGPYVSNGEVWRIGPSGSFPIRAASSRPLNCPAYKSIGRGYEPLTTTTTTTHRLSTIHSKEDRGRQHILVNKSIKINFILVLLEGFSIAHEQMILFEEEINNTRFLITCHWHLPFFRSKFTLFFPLPLLSH